MASLRLLPQKNANLRGKLNPSQSCTLCLASLVYATMYYIYCCCCLLYVNHESETMHAARLDDEVVPLLVVVTNEMYLL